jgi:hypothetical protein
MEVCGQFHDPTAFPKRKIPRYQLNRRLGGPQSGSGRFGDEKKPGIEPRFVDSPFRSLVTILTELHRLREKWWRNNLNCRREAKVKAEHRLNWWNKYEREGRITRGTRVMWNRKKGRKRHRRRRMANQMHWASVALLYKTFRRTQPPGESLESKWVYSRANRATRDNLFSW